MNVILWIIAGILAAAFAAAGLMKVAQPKTKLAESGMGWTEDYTDSQVKAVGAIEVLGALGLVLPAALDVAPILTPVAATGLTLVMLAAAAVHARRGEVSSIPVTLVLGAVAAFVAVMRFGPNSF